MNHSGYLDLTIGMAAVGMCGVGYPLLSVCFSRCMEALMVPAERYDKMRSQIDKYAKFLVVLACMEFVAYFIMFYFMGRAGDKLERKLKHTIFRHLLRMDIEFYDSGEKGSETVAQMLLDETSLLRPLGGTAVGQILISIVTLFVGVFVALAADWRLGLVCTACVPALIMSGFLQFRVQSRLQSRAKKAYEASALYAGEIVNCIKAVNSLTREQATLQRYYDQVRSQVKISRRHTLHTAACYAVAQVVSPFCISLGFWYGSILLLKQEVNMYQFYVSLMAVVTGSLAVQSIFSFAPAITLSKKCMGNLARLLDNIPEMDECSREGVMINNHDGRMGYGGTMNFVEGNIELRDVNFRYPFEPEMSVLRGVSFKIAAGEFAALVGPEDGFERSAVIELMEQFYRPSSGVIYMDNWDIKELNLESYRCQLGYVNSKSCLLEDVTIMDNLLIGLSDIEMLPLSCQECKDLAMAACRKVDIHSFIMSLPSGYDTSSGILFSRSQLFRFALARAIVRDPKVLLIDVPRWPETAMSEVEMGLIKGAVDSAAQGRTTLLVTNDLALTTNANLIFYMEHGRIVESGIRKSLLTRKGRYASMVESRKAV